MAATTTIRLPPKLRARLATLAKQTGRSAHSLIVEAVERHTDYEEQMRSLVKEALAADEDIDRTGEVYRAEDVHAWMERLARGGSPARPKPCRR
jgi:predicted transcriptional regulator